MLRARKPEAVTKRLKLFMFGPAGVGKTTAAIQFPNSLHHRLRDAAPRTTTS